MKKETIIKRNMAIIFLYKVAKMDIGDLAEIFKVSRALIYKLIKSNV